MIEIRNNPIPIHLMSLIKFKVKQVFAAVKFIALSRYFNAKTQDYIESKK